MDTIDYIDVTTVVEREGDQFVWICPELGTSSCGDTVQEALDNLREAIEVHLNGLEEVGERERVFQERGIRVISISSDSPLEGNLRVPLGLTIS